MSQFVVRFNFTAEEIGKGSDEQRRSSYGPLPKQLRQVGILCIQVSGDLLHGLLGTIHHRLRVGIPPKVGCLPSNILSGKVLGRQQASLFCQVEFGEASLAKVRWGSLEADVFVLQEQPDLLPDALVITGSEKDLDFVEEGIASQSDAQCLPGTVVRSGKGFGKSLAVIGEVFLDKLDDRASDVASDFTCFVASFGPDDLTEPEADQFAHE